MPIQGAALVFDGGAESWSHRLGLLLAALSFAVRPTRWCLCLFALFLRHALPSPCTWTIRHFLFSLLLWLVRAKRHLLSCSFPRRKSASSDDPIVFSVLSVAIVLVGWLAWSLVVAGPCSSHAPQRPRLCPASTSSHCPFEWFLVAARSRLVLTETTCPHHFSSLSSANVPLRL